MVTQNASGANDADDPAEDGKKTEACGNRPHSRPSGET
jgi:hypothetical protein